MKKVPITILLQAIGLTTKKILFSIKKPEIITGKKNSITSKSTNKAILNLNKVTIEKNKKEDII
jgi:DNA-directed RNA polymerase beta subunit